jgi:ABC-type Mn2+/Zn2+ transport system ATPase subunit
VTAAATVTVDELTVRYRDSVALDHVSFTAHGGQLVAVVGASGAGKSTLLKVLTGTLSPTSGRCRIESSAGVNVKVGFVPQLDASSDDCPLSALEVVSLGKPRVGLFAAKNEREQARILLERLGLAGLGHRTLSELSGGQRQRVAIARALATGADVIVCDEPTSGADPVRVAEIMEQLVSIARSGAVAVVSTHDVDRVARQADVVVALRDGAVVYCGHPDQLTESAVSAIYQPAGR